MEFCEPEGTGEGVGRSGVGLCRNYAVEVDENVGMDIGAWGEGLIFGNWGLLSQG